MRLVVLFLCTFLIALSIPASTVSGEDGTRMNVGEQVKPLKAVSAYCEALPSRCEPHPDVRMEMNAVRMVELIYINLIVNTEIVFQEEPPGVDVWQDRDFKSGDCEDVALLKRRELVALGWPPGALQLAIIRRNATDSELHALLVARTTHGDFVLDIADKVYGNVRPWNPKEFHELYMVWGADSKWYALVPEPVQTATATGEHAHP